MAYDGVLGGKVTIMASGVMVQGLLKLCLVLRSM